MDGRKEGRYDRMEGRKVDRMEGGKVGRKVGRNVGRKEGREGKKGGKGGRIYTFAFLATTSFFRLRAGALCLQTS